MYDEHLPKVSRLTSKKDAINRLRQEKIANGQPLIYEVETGRKKRLPMEEEIVITEEFTEMTSA